MTAWYGGQLLRFKCPGCAVRFEADPEQYLAGHEAGCCGQHDEASPVSEWRCDWMGETTARTLARDAHRGDTDASLGMGCSGRDGALGALHELSRASYRKMIQNLVWATGYNALAIPVAAGLFAPWVVILPMSIGVLAMSISTIVVALNAQLLRACACGPNPQARSRLGSRPRARGMHPANRAARDCIVELRT